MTTPFNKPGVPHRCRAGNDSKKRPRRLKPSTRAWKPENLLAAVREYVVARRASGEHLITAEEIAHVLRAKKGDVTSCMVKLAAEGLVGHKSHLLHDQCWWPSVYFLPRVHDNRVR